MAHGARITSLVSVIALGLVLGGCAGFDVVMAPPPSSSPNGPPPDTNPGEPGPGDREPTPTRPTQPTTPTQPTQPSPPTPSRGYGPSLEELDGMASAMLQAGAPPNTSLSGRIVEDVQNSGGVAAISFRGGDSIIFVHPDRRREWSHNTWAFIIGHELSHALLVHRRGGPQAEVDADALGADLATAAGYDVSAYIGFICSDQPNTCSASHGCFHDRMRRLEAQFNVSACQSDGVDHRGHAMALGISALGAPPVGEGDTCILDPSLVP